jgi:argininosuccinate lyase
VDTLTLALAVNTEMIAAMRMREDRCSMAAADPMLLATDLADYLVKRGVPFRHAHELVGKAVAESIASSTPLNLINLRAISDSYGDDTAEIFHLDRALAARTNPGCPNPRIVMEQVHAWKKILG